MSSYLDSIIQGSTASTTSTSASAASKNDDVLGKQDFLSLLVAQLQNQDPLNPDDPTEFTAQLAQFSSLEQLFNLNDSMEGLAGAYKNSDRLGSLNTIGRDVAYKSSSFRFDEEPVVIGYELDGQASDVTLSLQKDGKTIAFLEGTELSKGTHYITWDGLTGGGVAAPAGDYRIVAQAGTKDESAVVITPVVRSQVTGVDLEGENGGTLITRSGEISFNSIISVFEPTNLVKSDSTEEKSEEVVNNS